MQSFVRRIFSGSFGFALFCFVLPFVTVACPGEERSFTGLQLVSGTTTEQPQLFGRAAQSKVGAEPLVALALVCTLSALGLSLIRRREGALAAVGLGGLAALFLLCLRIQIASRVANEGQGMIQVAYDLGYWLTLVSLAVGIAFGIHLYQSWSRYASGSATHTVAPGAGAVST